MRIIPGGTYGSSLDTTPLYNSLVREFVSNDEPLTVDFRSLINWVRVGDRLTHLIHPYPAKLLPHIAHLFCNSEKVVPVGTAVLDPFCGSGTVALEATIAGRAALIADANPLALLLARVKTRPYDALVLDDTLDAVIRRARRLRKAPEVSIVNATLWYSARVKKELELVLRAVREIEDLAVREFFELSFSSAARRLSNADLTISVPVRMSSRAARTPAGQKKLEERMRWVQGASCLAEFERVCRANISRVAATNSQNPNRKSARVVGDDARTLSRDLAQLAQPEHAEVSLVMTSPPYGSAQKYVRASSLSLNWLGLGAPSDLARLESVSIGREHVHRSRDLNFENALPPDFNELIDALTNLNPRRARITEIYLQEFRLALREMTKVVSTGGRVAIVIGNNQVCGQSLRSDMFIKHVMEDAGMLLELELVDTIKSRGLMTKRNKTASVISRESVLVFKKE